LKQSSADSNDPRDPARSTDNYLAYVARMEKHVDLLMQSGNPAVSVVAGDYCVRMGRAVYSAGAPASECRRYLKRSADHQLRYFAEGAGPRLSDLRQCDDYLEEFCAAYLAGSANEVLSAFEHVKPAHMQPWERVLLGALQCVLQGRAVIMNEQDVAITEKTKEFAPLPGLFDAIGQRDQAAFAAALETYALKIWGPPAESVARKALGEAGANYTGKWSFFCAAMCAVMGGVPRLSKKALQYVPVDLLTA